ncbi:MAG: hypothetical protein R3E40_02070 [Rhodocyclaceae bacterium]
MALVNPHGGGALRPLLLQGEALKAELARAQTLPKIKVSSREKGDIIMLGIGGFTPLDGFMTHSDWQGVCDGMKMANGLFWPIPITLSTDEVVADGIKTGSDVALLDPDSGEILATMKVTEKYAIDKAHECAMVFKTTDLEHPGVKMVMEQGDINLAGTVKVLSQAEFPSKYGELFMTPAQTRALFESYGWSKVAAFQTRNPMHRSHEYLAKVAIETCDGVLIHSLLGNLKPSDIPADVRSNAIATLAEQYFVKKAVVQAGYPLDMRYAGPRRRCCMRCSARTMAVRTSSSAAIMPASAASTAPSTPTTSSTRSPRVLWKPAVEDRLDVLVLLRRHGLRPHLSARRCRPLAAFGHQAAQDAVGRRRGSGGVFTA